MHTVRQYILCRTGDIFLFDPFSSFIRCDCLCCFHDSDICAVSVCNREETFQYTEQEMRRRMRRLWFKAHRAGGIDLLLTHSPAAGLNDGDDRAHKGFACFNDLLEEYQPKWFVHGHVHLS